MLFKCAYSGKRYNLIVFLYQWIREGFKLIFKNVQSYCNDKSSMYYSSNLFLSLYYIFREYLFHLMSDIEFYHQRTQVLIIFFIIVALSRRFMSFIFIVTSSASDIDMSLYFNAQHYQNQSVIRIVYYHSYLWEYLYTKEP